MPVWRSILRQIRLIDAWAHAARATWNLLHDFWTMTAKCRRSLKAADTAIRQARKEIDWLGVLPAHGCGPGSRGARGLRAPRWRAQ
ncbi:hypothetical protein [Streptomyces avermitilis]|uniref:hypothetical protein n=1 Tax=Streptomyces avermitilis TaxID=33903 RepID=UPI0036BB2627